MRLAPISAVVLTALLLVGCSADHDAGERASPKPKHRHGTIRLTMLQTGSLREPLQDAAAAPIGSGRFVLLGGLDARDGSTDAVRAATTRKDATRGALPRELHDAAAVSLGGAVYLFGGGNGVAQLDAVVRVPAAGGTPRAVSRLPSESSDQAAAALGGTRPDRRHGAA
jgi:hypothetical protein